MKKLKKTKKLRKIQLQRMDKVKESVKYVSDSYSSGCPRGGRGCFF